MSTPDLSIIVAICDGHDALRACLTALRGQTGGHALQVIVPYDQISQEAGAMAADFPEFEFHDLGIIADGIDPKDALELHRFWDIRRSEGIGFARAPLIAMCEDRGPPKSDWAHEMITLHGELDAVAVGGCADNGYDNPWNWAIHFCDFGRYMAPRPTGETDFISATNVCYRADALKSYGHLYENGFYEPSLHAALQGSGGKMYLSDRPRTVECRPRIPTKTLAAEWFQWGRKYARINAGEVSTGHRIFRGLVTPLLPFVLFFRHLGVQREKKEHLADFWRAAPLVFMISAMWAMGELVGYVQGPAPEGY